jgi:Holliday junction resolvasome RuvABC DNA-binding subunit
MSDGKKSKKNGIEKLRMMLDDESLKKLDQEDEKYLISLIKRLDESSRKKVIIKQKVETHETKEDSLKPKVVIYERKQENKPILPKILVEEKAIEIKSEPIFEEVKEEKKFEEDLIEIKKVEIKEPEFLEVKPKIVKKEDKTEKKEIICSESDNYEEVIESKEEKEEITEWEHIKEEEQVQDKETKDEISKLENASFIEVEKVQEQPIESEDVCPSCGKKIMKEVNFCHLCGFKINETFEENGQNSDEKEIHPSFIPIEKEEKDDVDWEQKTSENAIVESEKKEIMNLESEEIDNTVVENEKETIEIDNEKEKKIEAFKEIQSIDEKTAILLYDNGFPSIDALNIASTQEISKITGIKKRRAKQIKKEINEIFEYKYIDVQETPESEVTEEKIKELDEEPEEDTTLNDEKIAIFNEIKSIDDETAIKLYDNGYNTIDSLKNATIDDLTKIPGIKKRRAKKIIFEIEEKIIQAAEKPKPIDIDETAQGELTEEQIKNKTDFEEEKEDDYNVEFESDKSECATVDEEQEFKEDEDIKKIEIFTEIESIDGETAILLYDNGFTSVELLKDATIKDLKKIKGIKKKKAKEIIFEIESRFKKIESESDESITEEYDTEYLEEKFDEDLRKVDEQIKKFEEDTIEENKEDTEFFLEETEIAVTEIKSEEKNNRVFNDIKSIDDKISTLLIENGIDTIEKIKDITIKDLTRIKGIRKKIAKQIKKEVELYLQENNNKDEEYKNINENPYINSEFDEIEDEWETIDEKKLVEDDKKIHGFMYKEYSLYEKQITTKSGNTRKVRFFSKGEPENAKPIDIPKGYKVEENKSGVPYLRKKKN